VTFISEWLMRLQSHKASVSKWEAQRRDEAAQLLRNAEEKGDWIRLTNHSNGFIREVAVRALCAEPSPEALVALIERLNDWVPQVRDLAAAGLNHYLSPSHAKDLLYALEPLLALSSRHRTDHGGTLAAVRKVLQLAESNGEVYANFLARQSKAARYLFTLLLESEQDTETLLRDALSHRELTVRLLAVDACKNLSHEQALPLLSEALHRPGAMVRVSVLRALLPLLENPKPLLRGILLDPSSAIRGFSRWAAARQDIDARAVLGERLTGKLPLNKRDWLGILGLAAELDIELESHWLTAAARSSYASVRQATMGRLGDGQLTELMGALDDLSDRVFFAAVARLNKLPWASFHAELNTKLDRDWHELPSVRRHALMGLRPKWQQVAYLLKRLAVEPVARSYWATQLDLWCNRQYQVVDPVTPKAERVELINNLRKLASMGVIRKASFAQVSG
jgi:hypothetical protein